MSTAIRLPAPDGPRALLVTARPPTHPWGQRALEGPSGLRLARLVGMRDLDQLLGTFATVDALTLHPAELRAAVERRPVVALGDDALRALLHAYDRPPLPAVPRDDDRDCAVGRLLRAGSPIWWAPHPSGRSPRLNPGEAVEETTRRLAFAALAARSLPHRGDMTSVGVHAAVAAGEHGALWRRLVADGVAWPGDDPTAGWEDVPGELPSTAVRRLGRAFLTVEGPPWRARVQVEGAAVGLNVTDGAGARALACVVARALGAVDPWTARTRELAGRSA